jgi:hypothetical protein
MIAVALQSSLLTAAQETSISNKLSCLIKENGFIDQLSSIQLLKNVLIHGDTQRSLIASVTTLV